MTALTSDLPRKSSRTSTQAVTVPKIVFRSVTARATPSVSFRAARASGLETTSQNEWDPFFFDSQRSAAMGRTTTTVRYVETTPTDRAVLARPPAPALGAARAAGAATLLMGGTFHRAFDSNHPAGVRVEPGPVHLPPTAKQAVADVEGRAGVVLLPPAREVGPLQDGLHDGAVAVRREDRLLLRRVGVRDERPRRGGRALDRDHRQLDQHRRPGDDELALLAGSERGIRLALVCDQDVAPAGEERVGCV